MIDQSFGAALHAAAIHGPMAPLFFVAALSAAHPSAPMPKIDIERTCRAEQVGALSDQKENVYRGCIRDEQTARDEVQRKWAAYPAGDRGACANLSQITGSYVEMIVCMEIKNRAAAPPPPPPQAPSGEVDPSAAPIQ